LALRSPVSTIYSTPTTTATSSTPITDSMVTLLVSEPAHVASGLAAAAPCVVGPGVVTAGPDGVVGAVELAEAVVAAALVPGDPVVEAGSAVVAVAAALVGAAVGAGGSGAMTICVVVSTTAANTAVSACASGPAVSSCAVKF